jgi:hypothetical protein
MTRLRVAGFGSRWGKNYLFFTTFRQALGLTQPHSQWIFVRYNDQVKKLIALLDPVPGYEYVELHLHILIRLRGVMLN